MPGYAAFGQSRQECRKRQISGTLAGMRGQTVGASQHGYHRDARETGLIEELFLEVRARSYGLRQINGQH
jgi:hypothetical protein